MVEGGDDGRPRRPQQLRVAEDRSVTPELEDELAVEVLPDVHVLESIGIHAQERVVRRTADVVGQGARALSRRRQPAPLDLDDRRVVDVHRIDEVANDRPFEVRPQPQQSERRIEVDVEGVVERVVEALDEGEPADVVRAVDRPFRHESRRRRLASRRVGGTVGPDCSAVGDEVQLVEERRLVPVGSSRVGEDRRLPGLDLRGPGISAAESLGRDRPGVPAGRAEEPRIPPVPARPGTEARHRDVPRENERDHP